MLLSLHSSTQCEVCQKTLGRRFGKQGYICRDCGYKCHKPCHVKTEVACPNSTVNNMDLWVYWTLNLHSTHSLTLTLVSFALVLFVRSYFALFILTKCRDGRNTIDL